MTRWLAECGSHIGPSLISQGCTVGPAGLFFVCSACECPFSCVYLAQQVCRNTSSDNLVCVLFKGPSRILRTAFSPPFLFPEEHLGSSWLSLCRRRAPSRAGRALVHTHKWPVLLETASSFMLSTSCRCDVTRGVRVDCNAPGIKITHAEWEGYASWPVAIFSRDVMWLGADSITLSSGLGCVCKLGKAVSSRWKQPANAVDDYEKTQNIPLDLLGTFPSIEDNQQVWTTKRQAMANTHRERSK